jgi:hypothetical protein
MTGVNMDALVTLPNVKPSNIKMHNEETRCSWWVVLLIIHPTVIACKIQLQTELLYLEMSNGPNGLELIQRRHSNSYKNSSLRSRFQPISQTLRLLPIHLSFPMMIMMQGEMVMISEICCEIALEVNIIIDKSLWTLTTTSYWMQLQREPEQSFIHIIILHHKDLKTLQLSRMILKKSRILNLRK